jgi:hypothetical protein
MPVNEQIPENEARVIADYKAGKKVMIIQMEHKLHIDALYDILHRHGIPQRRPHGAKPVAFSLQPDEDRHRRKRVTVMLRELIDAEVAYYKGNRASGRPGMDDLVKQYGEGSESEAFMEVWIEYSDELQDRLQVWIDALDGYTGKFTQVLSAFKEALDAIWKLDPEGD